MAERGSPESDATRVEALYDLMMGAAGDDTTIWGAGEIVMMLGFDQYAIVYPAVAMRLFLREGTTVCGRIVTRNSVNPFSAADFSGESHRLVMQT